MGLSKFLKSGFDDASYAPQPPAAKEVEYENFSQQLEEALLTDAAPKPSPEEGLDKAVADTGDNTGNVSVPDESTGTSVRKRAPSVDREASQAKKIKTSEKLGAGGTSKVKQSRRKTVPVRSGVVSGPGKGKGFMAIRKAMTGPEVHSVSSSDETASMNEPEKDQEESVEEEELPEGIFVPPFARVEFKSSLNIEDDRIDYMRNIMVPARRHFAEDMTDGAFIDFANKAAINMITSTAEYMRRFSLINNHRYKLSRENGELIRQLEDLENDEVRLQQKEVYEELRAEVSMKNNEKELAEQELESVRKRLLELEVDRDAWKNKYEEVNSRVEQADQDAMLSRNREVSLHAELIGLQAEKKVLVEGLPSLIRKFIKSDEFSKELSEVQNRAMTFGGYRALGRLKNRLPDLVIDQEEDYKPNSFADLITAGTQLEERDFPYLSRLASSFDVPAQEILQMEPATLEE